jgi:hypothetical protein
LLILERYGKEKRSTSGGAFFVFCVLVNLLLQPFPFEARSWPKSKTNRSLFPFVIKRPQKEIVSQDYLLIALYVCK